MAFPASPVDQQTYTTPLGTTYKYVASDDKWIIYTQTVVGLTGAMGVTGQQGGQGATGLISSLYNAGTVSASTFTINWSNGLKQYATVGASGIIGMINGATGTNFLLELRYNVNYPPGITGVKWPSAGSKPVLASYTGAKDLVAVFYDGQDYLGTATTDYRY